MTSNETSNAVSAAFDNQISKSRKRSEWFHFFTHLILISLAVFLLLTLIFGVAVTNGDSMLPTVENHDFTIFWRLSRSYDRGEIVILNVPGPGELIKRVVAVPGDTITADEETGALSVNGEPLLDRNGVATCAAKGDAATTYPISLRENEYFVLGDNRAISLDSRYKTIGVVNKSEIQGNVFFLARGNS